MSRGSVYNGTGNNRANERGCLPDNAEEAEEQKFLPTRCYLRDHDLTVAIPRADEKAVEGLVDLKESQVSWDYFTRINASNLPKLPKYYGNRSDQSKCLSSPIHPKE